MARYVIMSATDAKNAGVPEVHVPNSEWENEHDCLVDTARNALVWQDVDVQDAPEDMYLFRNLGEFVRELNRLAEESATPSESTKGQQ